MKAYQLGLYEKSMPNNLSFQQKLKVTKECGFDFIELSIDETDEKLARLDLIDSEIKNLIVTMEKEKVFIQSICLSGHRRFPLGSEDLNIQKKSLEIMEKAVRLAHRLGVRYIQIAGYDEYYKPSNEKTKANFITNLKKSVQYASKYGVILAFETMETPFMNTTKKAMQYVDLLASPYLKVYPDIGNITNAVSKNPEDVVSDLHSGKGHIVAAHLKETKPGIYRNLKFGEGHTDYQASLKELFSQGVSVFVAEFWYQEHTSWKHQIKKSYQFLTKEIEEAMNV
jgi:L-ribulose-5-phosphate 3-epimerase